MKILSDLIGNYKLTQMDIDKLFLSTLYYNSDGTTEFEEGTREYYTNKLFNDYITILKDSDRSFSELNGSIDNDTSLLKDIIGDIEANQKKNAVHPYSMYTLEKQSGTKDEFVSGKMGIGPYALNANNHILTMLYDVHFDFRSGSIMSWLGLNSLAKSSDRYGNSIMSWLSGLINAHVDVAKDSYISRLGVNKYTYNLVSLLVRTGLGKETFYMTTQPIMKRLSEAYSNANGVYMVNHNKSKSTVVSEMESAVILDMVESHTGTKHKSIESAFDEFLQSKVFDARVAYTSLEEASQFMNRIQMTDRTDDANLSMAKNLIQTIFAKDSEILRLISKNPPKDINQDNRTFEVNVIVNEDTQEQVEINLSVYDVQMIVALANEKFKMYSQALSNLVMYTKIDTKKEGKTLIEQRKYEEGYRQLFGKNSRSPIRHLFDTLSLDRLNKNSYIETKTNNATQLFKDVLSTQLIEATDEFDMLLDRLLNALGKTSQDMEAVRSVSKAIKAYIKSRFFFDSSVQGGLKYDHIEATHLVTGDNTIYDRLLQISTKMLTDPSYSDLVNKLNGMPKNYLLRNLVTSNTYRFIPDNVVGTYADQFNNAKFVQLISVMNDDMIDPDQVSKAWSELLNDTAHPELLKFARDLIVYAFITSGDNGGVNDLFKYVPVEWKLSSGYADYMRNMLIDYQNNRAPMLDYEDIILNNWYDRTFIPEESLSDYATNKSKFRKWMTHPITGYPIMLAALDDDREATIDKNGPLYIKIRRSDKDSKINGLRQYTIYKRVAFGITKKLDGNRTIKVRYPIYAMIDPRGNKFSKVHKIYAMSFDPQYSETSNVIQNKIGQLAKILGVTVTDPLSVLEKFSEYASNHVMLDGKVDGLIWVVRAMKNNVIEESLASMLAGYIREHSAANPVNTNILPTVNYYQGNIVPSADTIFVFGSNTQGRHGAGNARVASEMFGATYGVPEGLQGSSYAIVTKDLTKPKSQLLRSVSKELIIEGIKRMYETARTMPNYKFKVAYTNRLDETTLNGYTGEEMIEMFKEAGPIPSNVYFSEVWARSGVFDEPLTTISVDNIPTPTTPAANTYPVPGSPSTFMLHSGGAPGSDLYWDEVAKQYGLGGYNHYYYGQRSKYNSPGGNVEITAKEYEEGRVEAARAAARNWGYKLPKVNDSRLARNWMLVKNADAVFAVGHIAQPGEKAFPNLPDDTRLAVNPMVTGGTGYAVGMAILHNKPVYVFDQQVGKWYTWDAQQNNFVETDMPTLTLNFAGIGTREINEAGKLAIRDIFLKTFNKQQVKSEAPTNVPTASYGVEVSDGSKDFWNKVNSGWLNQHPNGIIAYRKHGSTAESFTEEVVNSGWLGNPFDWQKYGAEKATKMYYNWLKNGNSYNEPLATEESRQAAIQKILSTPEGSPVLYYKELGRPTHATILGYLINNKQLLLQQPKQQATINIYAGTGENADLSNFAERPFYDGNGHLWNSVEQAFQAAKLDFVPSLHYPNFGGPKDKYFDMMEKIEKMSPVEARKFGRTLSGLDVNNWDKESSSIMKELIKLSFELNPQALQRLLDTGDAILTHTQDKGKWGTEFPRLLMEVRDELRQSSKSNDTEQLTGVQDKEFYTKTAAYDYINDLVDIEGISRDNIELQHVPETDDTDDYWVVRVKDNSNDWNNPDEYSDEEMNHCK